MHFSINTSRNAHEAHVYTAVPRSFFSQESDLTSAPFQYGAEKINKLYLILLEGPERPELVSNQACRKEGIFWAGKRGTVDHRDAPVGWARNKQSTGTRGTHSAQGKTPGGAHIPCAIKDRGMG